MKTRFPVKRVFAAGRLWRRKLLSAVVLKALLLLSVVPVEAVSTTGSADDAPGLQAGSTLTFTAEADARVQESSPNGNYGSASYLQVDGASNPDIESFIRFTVSGAQGSVQSARLRVYVTSNASSNAPAVYAAGSSWTESGLTWNNRPARTSGALDNKGSTRKNSWVEYDVTAAVAGNGTHSFVLAADSSDGIRFSSREGSRPPQLVVTFNAATPTAGPGLPSATPTGTAVQPAPSATRTATQPPPVTVTRTATAAATSAPGQFTFVPTADSYVSSGSPSTNYGSETRLRGDGSPIVRSYLRFSVQGLSGPVTRATLRIYANSSSSGGYEIRGVSDSTWAESTITYNNAPPVGSVLGSSGGFSGGAWTSVDVTSYVAGNGTYNFGLSVPGSTAISFASREAGNNAPQLVVETQGGPVPPTATRTSTPLAQATATSTRTLTPVAQATATTTRTPTAVPTSSDSVVLVGAGDIANCSRSQDEQTAQLLDSIPGTVFTAGDNAYVDGTYTEYINCYEPGWGRHKSRTKPSPGNHDYHTSGAAGYFQYFNSVPSYYAYNLGAWRIYALNSEISVSSTSAQATWLRDDLAANPAQCVLAYWHKPRWSSGSNHGDNSAMQAIWQILYDAGADLVVNGHEHHYERFAEMNASGAASSAGLREIVVGTGGAGLYPFGTPKAASQVRNNTTYGVLKLTLHPASYQWEFVPAAGGTFTDSGSTDCH